MLLNYLVTSKTKRDLLHLLVAESVVGTANELALLSGATYSCVFDELQEMDKVGLVETCSLGKRRVYKLSDSSELKGQLLHLFGQTSENFDAKSNRKALKEKKDVVKSHLASFGAPVLSSYSGQSFLSLEESLALGVLQSKKDAVLLRSLPVLLWKQRNKLDFEHLLFYARKHQVKREMGFLLSLTSNLKKNAKLLEESKRFKDSRNKSVTSYFSKDQTPLQKKLEALNTPVLAKKWNFTLNMEMTNFRDFLEKYEKNK